MWLLLICTVLIVIGLCYLVLQNERKRSYFESKGIKYFGNSTVRIIRNLVQGVTFQDTLFEQYREMQASGKKFGVADDFGVTALLLGDPEVIKSVLIKDFDHFGNRRQFDTGNSDILFKKMLFSMTGERWKELRSKMSPTFTTGKIKRMFRLFNQSGQKFIKFLNSEIHRTGNEEIDLSKGYSKFTMDIIASAVCGIDSKAFDQTGLSVFEQMGKGLRFKFGPFEIIKFIGMNFLPKQIVSFLGLSFFKQEVQDFFSNAIKGVIKQRAKTGEKGDDFIQLMLEARAGTLKIDENELEAFEKNALLKESGDKKSQNADLLDDDGIVANCVLFLLAGFDTTKSLLLFCAYSMALNEEIQEKLRSEIDSMLEENNGQFTYDAINKLTYLDMIINETLRVYPPAAGTDRGCTIDYKVPGLDYVVKKGEALTIPIMPMHYDPQYFPDPTQFDPERFSPENKHKINPYTFLPFGQGPRNCIGMRFALIEAKVVLCYLIHHFRIEPSEKTLIPMKYSNNSALSPKGGMHLRLKKIEHS